MFECDCRAALLPFPLPFPLLSLRSVLLLRFPRSLALRSCFRSPASPLLSRFCSLSFAFAPVRSLSRSFSFASASLPPSLHFPLLPLRFPFRFRFLALASCFFQLLSLSRSPLLFAQVSFPLPLSLQSFFRTLKTTQGPAILTRYIYLCFPFPLTLPFQLPAFPDFRPYSLSAFPFALLRFTLLFPVQRFFLAFQIKPSTD